MREIKFRAWDEKEKIMVDSQNLHFFIHFSGQVTVGEFHSGGDFMNDENHFELMQFTGLKDKNGKEIYEGDILQYEDFDKNKFFKGIVSHDDFNFSGFYIEQIEQRKSTAMAFYQNNYEFKPIVDRNIEVIGNKFENPELLK